MLIALALLVLAAPVVRCSEEEEAPPAAGSPLDQYKAMAMEYFNMAVDVGTPYVEQAQELAGVYVGKAKEILGDTLDKLGVSKKDKTEL